MTNPNTPAATQPGKQQAAPPSQTDMANTEGERREPIHPDDIDAGSGYLGSEFQQPPTEGKPDQARSSG